MSACQKKEDTESGTATDLSWEPVDESVQDMSGDMVETVDDDAAENADVDTDTDSDVDIDSDVDTDTNIDDRSGAEDDGTGNVEDAFYYTALTEEIKERITGISYPDTGEELQISYEDLAYVHVLHYDFQAQVQEGELICNQTIAQDLVDIFRELYDSRYPIEKIRLIDEYGADDEASMADNNTSCFNYRTVPGRTKLSNHSYGCAIDINPLYNPYVRTRSGEVLISPDNAAAYADRSVDFPHKIDRNDLCYRIFAEHGFDWGGAWNSSKDYQHFEKVP